MIKEKTPPTPTKESTKTTVKEAPQLKTEKIGSSKERNEV